MSKVKWIKITTNVFDDEKIQLIESMPESDTIIVIWFKLLALAGKSNNGGLVMISDKVPYTVEMLTTLFRRKLTVVQLALHTFEQFGMIEILDNDTILISNWEKHQNEDKLLEIREKQRLRQKEYRDKKKQQLLSHNALHNGNALDTSISSSKSSSKSNPLKEKYYDVPELQDLFIEFLQIRKKLKAVNSDRAIKLQLSKLEKFDNNVKKQMLENAIANSWKSVYELNTNGKTKEKAPIKDWREY